jgi:hypothetical protein
MTASYASASKRFTAAAGFSSPDQRRVIPMKLFRG